jgi:hypothetical protein
LAVRLGILHVERDILQGLTAKEFRGWEMYCGLEPFGETRDDFRTASIVQMLYNVNRGAKQKALPLKDFVLTFGESEDEKPKRQTWQQQLAIMKMMAAAYATDAPTVPNVTEGIGPPLQPAVVEETEDARVARYMAEHMAPKPE